MAGKKLKLDDFKKKTTPLHLKQIKGGYNLVSPAAGSMGQIQWDEIDIRNLGESNLIISEQPLSVQPSRVIDRK